MEDDTPVERRGEEPSAERRGEEPSAERRGEETSTDRRGDQDESRVDGWRPSRRRLVQTTAAAGAVGGFGALGLGGGRTQPTQIRLVGRVEGWVFEGDLEAPFIAGGPQNPTLRLQPGQEYEVVWENADGAPHNFVVRGEGGENLVRTEIISEEGATQTVGFTATEQMATYLCEVHPNTMRGDVEVVTEPTPTPEPEAQFFEDGTEVGVRTVAEGMTAPTDFAVADGQDDRFYVTDQTGEVWIVTGEGRLEEPFVNVSDRIVELGRFFGEYADAQQEYDERGLLGIAFHPDFADNGRFFLHYSAPPDGVDRDLPGENWDHWEVLSEFTASGDPLRGDPDSERRLLEIPSPQYNHDAGPMAFGPDGYLYFPMGDGGGANDNMYGHVPDWYDRNGGGNGQDVFDNLLGDVLRIDVDGGASETPRNGGGEAADTQEDGTPYGVPDDNPFVGTDALSEIYAYGFRNPFGISFDSQGNLFVADAGQNLWEEANVVVAGGNYGWNVREGTHCFSADNPAEPDAVQRCPTRAPDEAPYDGAPLRDPIVEFPHRFRGEAVGITVVGGHRYEQTTISGLEGKYVFGAWTTDPARRQPAGRVLAATPPEGFDGTPTPEPEPTREEPEGVPRGELWDMAELVFAGSPDGTLGYFVRMFGRDADGEIYVLVSKRGVPLGDTGAVLKLVPPGEGEELAGTQAETPTETPTEGVEETPTETPTEGVEETPTETPTEGVEETPTEGGGY